MAQPLLCEKHTTCVKQQKRIDFISFSIVVVIQQNYILPKSMKRSVFSEHIQDRLPKQTCYPFVIYKILEKIITKEPQLMILRYIHLLLFITAKYAFICANRQSIKRIYIHLHEAAIIYAKRALICKFCIIFGIQLHYWSFNCAFGHSMKKINLHLREYLYHWRKKKIQVRQSKVNSVKITFI